MSLPTSSLPELPASDDNDLQTLHLVYQGHACSGTSLPRHLSPLLPHFLFLTPLQPHWYFSSRKHQALFWPRSLAFTLHSEWNILLPEPIPKTAANSPFQSQRKCHLLCLTALVAFSSHHPSLPYCPTYPLQFYIVHLFSKTILFAYFVYFSVLHKNACSLRQWSRSLSQGHCYISKCLGWSLASSGRSMTIYLVMPKWLNKCINHCPRKLMGVVKLIRSSRTQSKEHWIKSLQTEKSAVDDHLL